MWGFSNNFRFLRLLNLVWSFLECGNETTRYSPVHIFSVVHSSRHVESPAGFSVESASISLMRSNRIEFLLTEPPLLKECYLQPL